MTFEQSCQKIDTTDLGIGLIPAVDNIKTFDTTLEVIAASMFMREADSVRRTEDHALGVMEDPEFGRTSASIFFEVLPATSGAYPFTNKDSAKLIDSVVLSVFYRGLYGDSNSIQNFNVYEIEQSAKLEDSVYAVNAQDFPVVFTPLGQATVNFTTLNDPRRFIQGKDTNIITQENVLRIKLNKSLGERLAGYDTTAYKSDSSFRTYFKGLALKADTITSPHKKALAYFNISDSKTRLTVYYRIAKGVIDTTFTDFTYRATQSTKNPGFTANRNVNLIRRNISGSNYSNNISGSNKQKIYIQSNPGSFTTIHVPGLKTLTNRVIHKAELIIERLPSAEDNFFTPPILFLDLIDSAKNKYVTVQNDFIYDNQSNYNIIDFGGIIKNSIYSFNISRHIQGIVSRKNEVFSFRLQAPFYTWPSYANPGSDLNNAEKLGGAFPDK